ncbi:MAG: hypothetical protein ACO31Z_04725 [Litorivicinaceae bacterium]
MYRRALQIADWVLTVLFVLSALGVLYVYGFSSSQELDVLIFFSVLGVPYGALRFVVLGSPIPFTRIPHSEDAEDVTRNA